MRELPPGWSVRRVADVSDRVVVGFVGPARQHYRAEGVPLLMGKNVRAGRLDLRDLARVTEEFHVRERKSQLAPGDVVVVRIGRSGDAAVVPADLGAANCAGLVVIKQPSEVTPDFLAAYLNSPAGQKASLDEARGVTRQTLNTTSIAAAKVPVPPLNEQRRIIAKLGELRTRSRRAREALDSIPPLLEKLRQSILAAAFRGDLTRDWRAKHPDVEPASELLKRIRVERRKKWEEAELARMVAKGKPPKDDRWKAKYEEPKPVDPTGLPELPEGWCWASADQLLVDIEAGRSPKAEGRPAEPHEQGVLKVSAVSWEHFDPLENKALAPGDAIGDAPTVRAGDLLISRANTVELVGAVVLVEQDFPNLMLSDKTLRLAAAPGASPELLLHGLRTRAVRALFEGATGTSDSMRNITQQTIRSAPIALPPASETEPLLRAIRAAMAARRALARALEASIDDLARLDRATLARAFRGELVPQDPNDEPLTFGAAPSDDEGSTPHASRSPSRGRVSPDLDASSPTSAARPKRTRRKAS